MAFRARVLTLYPEMFPGHLGFSLAGKAMERGQWSLDAVQIRDFATDRHRTVDDTPAGGGAGMVLKPDVLARAIDSAGETDLRPRLLMSPRGRPLTQQRVRELAAGEGVIIVCGRFEGVDQRVIEARGLEEVSIGDYVLSGGELGAAVIVDAVTRLQEGALNDAESAAQDSFEGPQGLLDCPHYSQPAQHEWGDVPDVLRSGNHAAIARWRRQQSLLRTSLRRPDLLDESQLSKADRQLLAEAREGVEPGLPG